MYGFDVRLADIADVFSDELGVGSVVKCLSVVAAATAPCESDAQHAVAEALVAPLFDRSVLALCLALRAEIIHSAPRSVLPCSSRIGPRSHARRPALAVRSPSSLRGSWPAP